MTTASLATKVKRLETLARTRTATGENPLLARLRADPANTMRLAGLESDHWQAELIRSDAPRTLLLATRQGGKSTAVGALALYEAMARPGSLVLLPSPSERQSAELFLKVTTAYDGLGQPVPARKRTELSLSLV